MTQKRLIESPEKMKQRIVCRESRPASARSFQRGLHPVLYLQRTVGNRAVGRLIQAKLAVNHPGDPYAREAERVAEQVTSMPSPESTPTAQRQITPEEEKDKQPLQTKPLAASITPLAQRQAMPEEGKKEEPPVQNKPLPESITPFAQRQMIPEEEKKEEKLVLPKSLLQGSAVEEIVDAGHGIEQQLGQSSGIGGALPESLRSYMEPRFGTDFSGVRVHTGSESQHLNRSLDAQAFTVGQDIYCGASKSPTDLRLTDHELTHVVQQTGGGATQRKLARGEPDIFLQQGEYNSSSRAGQELLAHKLTHVVHQDGEQLQRARTQTKEGAATGGAPSGREKGPLNFLSTRTVQRVGGWADADTKSGKGIAAGEPQTGWNVEEHAVGGIRRIPLDGLTGGLQRNPTESASAGKLTDEKVAGAVKGAARSDAGEQKGRGRAIALVPSLIKSNQPVDVLFHLHGNTEFESRGFGGWRQHEPSAEVRDVERDRIAQQIEAAKSTQIVGILPQGVNESNFGQISPDAYIRDAFDRLTEVGAWTKAPPSFRVVLSAHSGGGFTVGRMISGWKGYQLPANLKTLILFEALHARPNDPDPKRRFDQVDQFGTWIEGMLAAHMAFLNDPAPSAADKQARLDAATQVRLYWDPKKSYNGIYVRMGNRIDAWFTRNKSRLGANYQVLRDLVVLVPKAGVTHEGIVRAGITESLTATTGAGGAISIPAPAGSPTSAPAGATTRATAAPASISFAAREAAITPAMVAALAGAQGTTAGWMFGLATDLGLSKLRAAAMVLCAVGNRSDMDLTDALFALVYTELEGGRIRNDQENLKQDWRMIRRDYARPALNASRATAPAAPVPPVPKPATPSMPAVVDPATAKPAKAATGVKALTADEKKRALEDALKQATTAGKKADRDAVTNTLLYNNTDDNSWWGGMVFNASFLDVPIRPSAGGSVTGVHSELFARLVKAETKLMSLFPGLSKAQIAGAMGIYEIKGVRPPQKATGGKLPSYHCFGLAIDINHPTNPFVGNQKPTLDANADKKVSAEEQAKYDLYMQSRSPRIIERAMLLLRGEQFDIEQKIKVPTGAGTAAGRLWEIHHRASETLAEYLRLADDLDGQKLKDLVDARRKAGDSRDLAFWKQRIADDKVLIKPWDFMHHKSPEKGGYMDLGKELVEALVEDGQLLWGGNYPGAKDMMHFDWRSGTISKRPPKGWRPQES